MKRLIVRGALAVLFLAVPCWCLATDPFQIRIVDQAGRGVADPADRGAGPGGSDHRFPR